MKVGFKKRETRKNKKRRLNDPYLFAIIESAIGFT